MAWRHNLQSQATLAHPPPGWTKTPLFLELSALKEHRGLLNLLLAYEPANLSLTLTLTLTLTAHPHPHPHPHPNPNSALKEHVAALTDERERLNAFAQEITERCSAHEEDLGRLKNAFTALAEHVDAEVGRLDVDGRSAATEMSGLQAQVDLLKASGARADHALTADRARFDAAGVQADEAVRHLAAELGDLRLEIAGAVEIERQIEQMTSRDEKRREAEARSREEEARCVRQEIAEMKAEVQGPLRTLQYSMAACAQQQQQQQLAQAEQQQAQH